MKSLQTALLGAALVAVAAGAVHAQGKHVKWLKDGTVELIMTDGTVIKTSRGEPGTLFGPGQKPLAGKEIPIPVQSRRP